MLLPKEVTKRTSRNSLGSIPKSYEVESIDCSATNEILKENKFVSYVIMNLFQTNCQPL